MINLQDLLYLGFFQFVHNAHIHSKNLLGPLLELLLAYNKPERTGIHIEPIGFQTKVARLEGGRVHPSIKTLARFAKATGTRLKITFEPDMSRQGS